MTWITWQKAPTQGKPSIIALLLCRMLGHFEKNGQRLLKGLI
jgi:hypothetical protein